MSLDDVLRDLLWDHRIIRRDPATVCACGVYPRVHADHQAQVLLASDWLRAVKAAEHLKPRPDPDPVQDPNPPDPWMSGTEADHEAAVAEDNRMRDVDRGTR